MKINKILIYLNILQAFILLGVGILISFNYLGNEKTIELSDQSLEESNDSEDYAGFITKEFSQDVTVFGENTEDNLEIEVKNEIKVPESWIYEQHPVEDGTLIKNGSDIEVSDPENKVRLSIYVNMDNHYSPIQISNQYLLDTKTYPFNSLTKTVNILRNKVNDYYYSYSETFYDGSDEEIVYSDVFRIYSENENTPSWSADVIVYFSEDLSIDEINQYLKTVDAIVLSIRAI